MTVFVQSALNGPLLGGLYALIGLGMSPVFGVLRVINLAYDEMPMVGMYITFFLFTAGTVADDDHVRRAYLGI